MTQAAQDLLWVVNSPSFVTGSNVAPTQTLNPASIDQGALDEFLGSRQEHRVGRYFEHLLHFWLAHVRSVEIVGAGLQIRDGKRTVGELDFLYRDERNVLIHCEASVKFFLHFPRAGESHYPGPNASDNFELKTAKLFDQQLELSREHYPEVAERHAFVKGMVFYHEGGEPPAEIPHRMNPAHLRGSWLRASDLDVLATRTRVTGVLCEKPLWLAPAAVAAQLPIDVVVQRLRKHFGGPNPHPVMVSVRDEHSAGETQRVFVVSNEWPAR